MIRAGRWRRDSLDMVEIGSHGYLLLGIIHGMSQTGSGENVTGRWGLLRIAEIKKPPHREGCEGREFHVLSMDTQAAAAPVGTTSTPTRRMRLIPLNAMRLLPTGNTTSRGSAEYDMRAYSLQPRPLLVK